MVKITYLSTKLYAPMMFLSYSVYISTKPMALAGFIVLHWLTVMVTVKWFFVTSITFVIQTTEILFLFLQVILSDYESGDSIANVNDDNGKCKVNKHRVDSMYFW